MKPLGRLSAIIIFYLLGLTLLVLMPINNKESAINTTYIFRVRLDYILHSFLLLPWMCFYFLGVGRLPINSWQWWMLGTVLSFLIEFIQYPMSYRSFNKNDIGFNLIGLLFGTMIYLIIKKVCK